MPSTSASRSLRRTVLSRGSTTIRIGRCIGTFYRVDIITVIIMSIAIPMTSAGSTARSMAVRFTGERRRSSGLISILVYGSGNTAPVNRVSEAVPRSAHALPITDSIEAESHTATASTIESFLAGIEQRAYRFALYELWDRDAALDAVQDSMWRLVERYATRPAGEWPALFFTILRNRTTDAKRWRVVQGVRGLFGGGARHEIASEQALLAVPASPDETPEARQTATERRRALRRALAELPARQRQTFLLRECEGLTTAETARTLGCSEGTVKQHHFRALQTLRAKLSKVWYENTN